jgi:pyruvate/2-oxoglutarate dehydrogenase complex dihydrolipoamide acyltransferase (E2) component
MVKVSQAAISLICAELDSAEEVRQNNGLLHKSAAQPLALNGNDQIGPAFSDLSPRLDLPRLGLARAQSAGEKFSGVSAARVAGTTQAILNAVSFPRFVTELITGVFRAVVDSSQEQMRSYVELLRNVAATTEGFADTSLSNFRARQWLADQFPGCFEVAQDEDEQPQPGEPPPESTLRLRSGASFPSEQALRASLGIPPDQSVPSGDPERNLLPFARLALARQRQQMLATLVMLGMQRIVIESGRINASMRFHIDTRSAAQEDEASRFALENEIRASGSYGIGVWGASASMRNNIAYVSTQKTQTTEEMNTDLELNSSVELYFKSDYLPLDRLAGGEQQNRIRANTLNPEAEAKLAAEARAARIKAASESDAARRANLDKELAPRPIAPAKEGEPGTQTAADKARREAAKPKEQVPKSKESQSRKPAAPAASPPAKAKDEKQQKTTPATPKATRPPAGQP